MLVPLHRKCLEPALVQMPLARRLAVRMPALRVRQRHPRQKPREVPVAAWPQHQMPMIRHEAIREGPHWDPLVSLLEDPLERPVVPGFLKELEPAISPVQHGVDQAAASGTERTPHGALAYPHPLPLSIKRFLTPFSTSMARS